MTGLLKHAVGHPGGGWVKGSLNHKGAKDTEVITKEGICAPREARHTAACLQEPKRNTKTPRRKGEQGDLLGVFAPWNSTSRAKALMTRKNCGSHETLDSFFVILRALRAFVLNSSCAFGAAGTAR